MLNPKQNKRISKFLSLLLRHKPELLNLDIDAQGWVNTQELIQKCQEENPRLNLTMENLTIVVDSNAKKRFAFNTDKSKIRASQGHSIPIDLGYQPKVPPTILYHGTASRFLESILSKGLEKGNRHHVHLSKDIATALQVGQRHGKPILLEISALRMYEQGYTFFISENGVWLTDHVPTDFIVQYMKK
ncbi:MAG: RNA 2'-phosphotransferase [Saprospiraceae bacterium]|nr:RNA 2'-phosphotransferase [Saprospiraceae bacterium]